MEPLLGFGANSVALEVSSDELLRELVSDCSVAEFIGPDQIADNFVPFKALWDTGATNSVITERVVQECNLVPTGKTFVYGVNGRHLADTYVISIQLQGVVLFRYVRVTEGDFLGADVLVGMDIINQGDFAVTNRNGQTRFAYRVPSQGGIDFSGFEDDEEE